MLEVDVMLKFIEHGDFSGNNDRVFEFLDLDALGAVEELKAVEGLGAEVRE